MSYKIKSLIYFAVLVVSAVILHITDIQQENTLPEKTENINQAITDNGAADVENEAELLGEVKMKHQ